MSTITNVCLEISIAVDDEIGTDLIRLIRGKTIILDCQFAEMVEA